MGNGARHSALGTPIPALVALAAAVLCPLAPLRASRPSQGPARGGLPIAVVNANVVRLDSQAILPLQTVLVSEGRILSVGTARLTAVPKGSRVIDAAGGYLLPGLVDAHVHLSPGWRASGFAEARRYLVQGITTLVNFGGSPELLDLRQEIELGRVLGPTLYTAGPYIEEPVVRTPSDVEREVARQLAAGYDFLKFHPVDQSGLRTSTGLSHEAYVALLLAARKWKVPVMGHLPRSASLEEALEAGQSL